MMHGLFELTVNLIEALIFFYVIFHCLAFRSGTFSKCFCIISDFAVVTACNLLVHNLVASICINLAARVAITFGLTKGSVSAKLFWGSFSSIIFLISENLAFLLCRMIAGNEIETILNATSFRYGACSLYIILSAVFALSAINIKKQEFHFPVPALISLMLLVITGILAMTTLMITINRIETQFSDTGTHLISPLYFVWFSFWAIWILLFSLLTLLGILNKKNLSLIEENEMQRLEEAQYKSLQSSNRALRAWKHDNIGHLQTITLLLEQQQYSKCMQYVEHLSDGIQADALAVHTGNYALDAILSIKKLEAQAAGIDFIHKLYLPEASKLPLTDIQISSLLGNLLSNAIEAAGSVPSSYIHFEMKMAQSDQLLIMLKNSSRGNYRYDKKGHLISTKNGTDHGIGLKQIERTVENAGGLLEMSPMEDCYCVSIILPLKEEDTLQSEAI